LYETLRSIRLFALCQAACRQRRTEPIGFSDDPYNSSISPSFIYITIIPQIELFVKQKHRNKKRKNEKIKQTQKNKDCRNV